MKMARATDDDMQRMFDFFNDLDDALHDLPFGDSVDSEALGEIVKKHWKSRGPGVGGSWHRVLFGMQMLLKNCTDPDAETLEWRPDIRAWLESKTD